MSKMSFPEVIARHTRMVTMIAENGGEIPPELDQELTAIEIRKAGAVDFYSELSDRSAHEAEYWRQKAAFALKAASAMENISKRIKDRIKYTMIENGITEISGDENTYKLIPMKSKLVIDDGRLPEIYKEQVVDYIPNKDKIRDAIERGEFVPGASLEEVKALRKYAKKGAS